MQMTINGEWTNKSEEYIKLGLTILFRKFKSLQDFASWLNNEIEQVSNKNNDNSKFAILEPTLSRYLTNKIGISQRKGKILQNIIDSELEIQNIIQDKIKDFAKDNWVSINTRVILTDIVLLTFIVIKKLQEMSDSKNIDAIITPEADGIPLGVILAQQLKCKCIYVRKNKRAEDTDFVQVEVQRYRNVVNYYLSLKELPPDSKVLLVDDIKRSGSTLKHLEELIEKAGSKVIKKMVLIDVKGNNDVIKKIDSFLQLTA